jgi:transcriptional regulator with XRE-family HTH domain
VHQLAHQAAGRLNIEAHPFLTSPLPAWEMPDDLASRLGSSQSRVAKLEAADATVSLDLLIRGLLALGASRREIGRALSE